MKKKLSIALLLLLVLACTVSGAFADSFYVNTPNGKSVNLRDYADLSAPILTTVPNGARVERIEMIVGSQWMHVVYNGYYGYIMNRYLSDKRPNIRPTATPRPTSTPYRPTPAPADDIALYERMFSGFEVVNYYAVVTPTRPTGYVNLRWAPTKSAPVMEQCLNGQELEVLQENGVWCQVRMPGTNTVGFMMSEFMRPVYGSYYGEQG